MIPEQTLLYIKLERKPEDITHIIWLLELFYCSPVSKSCWITVSKGLLLLRNWLFKKQDGIYCSFISVYCSSLRVSLFINMKVQNLHLGLVLLSLHWPSLGFHHLKNGTLYCSILLNSSYELPPVTDSASSRLEIHHTWLTKSQLHIL